MPEPTAWRYQKITKPMFDLPREHVILRGRVLTAVGDEVIEDGYVEFDAGKILAVGPATELGSRADAAIVTGGTATMAGVGSIATGIAGGAGSAAEERFQNEYNGTLRSRVYSAPAKAANARARPRPIPSHRYRATRRCRSMRIICPSQASARPRTANPRATV